MNRWRMKVARERLVRALGLLGNVDGSGPFERESLGYLRAHVEAALACLDEAKGEFRCAPNGFIEVAGRER